MFPETPRALSSGDASDQGAPRARPSASAEAPADKPERSKTANEALARRSLGEGGSDGAGESEGRSPSDLVR
jgi:hypothetical protein